jgi:hypothetical protein
MTADVEAVGGLEHRDVLATMTVGGATTAPGRSRPTHPTNAWCAITRTPLSHREEPS